MVRECVTAVSALGLALLTGCSLILDFSGPSETPIDAPFTQAECDFKEPNDTIETAAVLDVAEVGPAAICSATAGVDDHDFYRITLPANSSASFKVTFLSSPTGDLDIKLSDAQGAMLSSSRGFDDEELIVCPGASPPCTGPLAEGDYILEVFPAQPGMANRYDIALTVTP
jgi:hypothetical protein